VSGYELWDQLLGDIHGYMVVWELAVLVLGLLLAWIFNKLILATVFTNAPESWKVGMGGVARIIFPLLALITVHIGQFTLDRWQYHTSLLQLATILLLAMGVIRLTVYALRYVFPAGGWVRTTETFIVWVIWGLVALHLAGLLTILSAFLEGLSFSLGKHEFSVLLLIQSLLIVVVTLVVTLWAGRIMETRLMHAENMDMNLRVVLSKLLRVVLIVVGVLSSLSFVGFDITLLSVFGGALGVGLGFGLQKIASNYVSGFIILLDRSIHLGDVLTVDGHQGVANQLRARYLVLRKLDGTEVVIPNDTLITSTVINHSLSDRKAQVQVPVHISYDSPLETAMSVMRASTQDINRILKDPAPDVNIKALNETGVHLEMALWVNDPEAGYGSLQSMLYMKILQGFRANGIKIAYPQRDVRLTNVTPQQ